MYDLVGVDGNAYSIMGYVKKAMRAEKCTSQEIDEYLKDAMSSDYNHLLTVSISMIDKLNEKHGGSDYE